MQGTVRWYSAQGFGFIDPQPCTDGKAVYFHIADVKGRTILKAGDEVTFDVVPAPKGPKGVNVRLSVVDTKGTQSCTALSAVQA